MVAIPQQLFKKATAHGLLCLPSEQGDHRIHPQDANPKWYLVCQNEVWVLVIDGHPQVRFRYQEVMQFIDRYSQRTTQSFPQKLDVAPTATDVRCRLQAA